MSATLTPEPSAFDYCRYFGFNRQPFVRKRVEDGLGFDADHRRRLLRLCQSLHRGTTGPLLILGAAGTGKTLLAERLVSALKTVPGRPFAVHWLRSPPRTEAELCAALGLDQASRRSLGARLRELPPTCVLIVDEAERLPAVLMDALLDSSVRRRPPCLALVLIGLPTLSERLGGTAPALVETLQALSLEQTERFIQRELMLARLPSADILPRAVDQPAGQAADNLHTAEPCDPLPPAAIGRIFLHTRGVQRQISKLCDRALLAARLSECRSVPVELIDEVAAALLISAEIDPEQTTELPARFTLDQGRSAPQPRADTPGPALTRASPGLGSAAVGLLLGGSGLALLYDSLPGEPPPPPPPVLRFGDISRISSEDLALQAPAFRAPALSSFDLLSAGLQEIRRFAAAGREASRPEHASGAEQAEASAAEAGSKP